MFRRNYIINMSLSRSIKNVSRSAFDSRASHHIVAFKLLAVCISFFFDFIIENRQPKALYMQNPNLKLIGKITINMSQEAIEQ